MKLLLPILALVAATAVEAQVEAQPAHAAGQYQTTVVRYGDLDLRSSAGRATLAARIHRAASATCDANDGLVDLESRLEVGACMRTATAAAMKTLTARTELAYAGR